MALSKATQDHEEIRQWAEERGARPAEVAATEGRGGSRTGILRLEFPGAPGANDAALKEIGWDEFFEKFDANGLEFIYQDKTADGAQSNFNKLVYPENESKSVKKKSAVKKTPAKKTPAKTTTAKKTAAKVAAVKAPAKTPAKTTPAKKTAAKAAPAKKTVVKKTASKKTAAKTDFSQVPQIFSTQVL